MPAPMVVGSVLVRNEDVFVEQAVRNVAEFCDRIFVVDHLSTDGTAAILERLAEEFDHVVVRRARHARVSHEMLEPYMGTRAWALRVDGDELYDPGRLTTLRAALDDGLFDSAFRVMASVFHCVTFDCAQMVATGHLSPPSRPITGLFNLGAVNGWTGCAERLHAGAVDFRPGFGWDVINRLDERETWVTSPFRYLHMCFMRRSSIDDPTATAPRLSLGETGRYRRGLAGAMAGLVRRPHVDQKVLDLHADGSTWKLDKYRRGPVVETDTRPFFTR